MNNTFHFKSFLNFLRRNKMYTAINIFGFGVSLMFVILLGLYIQDEFTVDSDQVNKDRIYRLEHENGANFGALVAADIANRYPEIESTVRTHGGVYQFYSPENELFQANTLETDSTFFSVFSYPFLEGSPSDAMRSSKDIVLSESFARKVFGHTHVVGQSIKMKDHGEYMISGVLKDFKNSHFTNPDVLLSIRELPELTGWDQVITTNSMYDFGLYVLTRPGTDLPSKAAEMEEYFVNDSGNWYFNTGRTKDLRMVSLKEAYFSSESKLWYTTSNNMTYLTIFSVTALLILVFAVINYINLSVAQTGFRAKEAATRRLLGGTKGQLFLGFITESIVLCGISMLLAIGLALLAEPLFQNWFSTSMSVMDGLTGMNLLYIALGILVLGVASGIVPALAISGFKPIDVVRGTFKRKTKMVYSKVMISFQYCITIALIGCTIVIGRQVKYMQKSELGFNKDYVVAAGNPVDANGKASFRDQLLAIPGVEQVSFARGVPMLSYNNNSFTDQDGVNHSMTRYAADSMYLGILGMEVLHRTGIEDAEAVWLNETAWRRLGMKDGDIEYKDPAWSFKVKGVVKDFHTNDFSSEIGEAMIEPLPEGFYSWNVVVKVSSANPFGTMDQLKTVFNERYGGNLFDGQFLDQAVAKQYQEQEKTSKILTSLSVLAILISALGMLAMSTYFMRQRSQEVAVRKVFGATISEVLLMLMMSFMKLVIVAFVIAIPVIWYAMKEWLSGYTFRINLSWELFALAGLLAISIAALSVFWQSYKTANTNPIVAIRD